MKIGLFGGTFDPVHTGHLILAERCRDEAGLDMVWFLPSYKPPHKPGMAITRFEHRVEMATLALAGQTQFRVETVEKDLPPPSYTAETLAALHKAHPQDSFALILGADSVLDLPNWYQPQRVVAQAEILAVPRPGAELWSAERLAGALRVEPGQIRMRAIPCPLVDIASRDLRSRVRDKRSIRFLVPRSVEEYIREKRLYSGSELAEASSKV